MGVLDPKVPYYSQTVGKHAAACKRGKYSASYKSYSLQLTVYSLRGNSLILETHQNKYP